MVTQCVRPKYRILSFFPRARHPGTETSLQHLMSDVQLHSEVRFPGLLCCQLGVQNGCGLGSMMKIPLSVQQTTKQSGIERPVVLSVPTEADLRTTFPSASVYVHVRPFPALTHRVQGCVREPPDLATPTFDARHGCPPPLGSGR